jgi:hypothetical protein
MNNGRIRGRPRKTLEAKLRDQAASDLASLQNVWIRVQVAKRQRHTLSIKRICELLVEEARRIKQGAPRVVQEGLSASQKYLFDPDSFRRLYYRANALVKSDPAVAHYCKTELSRRLKVERIN